MSKFKIGDKVVTEDGEHGVVALLTPYDDSFIVTVRIFNRIKAWHEDGLRFDEEDKRRFRVRDVVYIRAIVYNPETDDDGDITCFAGKYGLTAFDIEKNVDDYSCHTESEVFTLDELREMKG